MKKNYPLFAGSDNTPSEESNVQNENTTSGEQATPPAETNPPKQKPSDEVAKLLKEVMEKKQTINEQKAKLEELEKLRVSIEAMGGVETLTELAKNHKEAQTRELEAKGEWEKLKAQMVEEHTKATEGYRNEIKTLKEQLASEGHKIAELTVGSAFGNSQFLNQKTILSPAKARIIYGDYFETAENGEVVAYDKPKGSNNRTQLVDQYGNGLSFDKAIEKIIMSDPDKDSFLRVSGTSGAGSTSEFNSSTTAKETTKKTSLEMIASGLAKLK